MAIGATIAAKLKNDEFDIDVIVKLNIDRATPPGAVLNALFEAVNGEPGSIYHGKVTRNSRCVTIEYESMHLDITPAVRMTELAERTSTIFHAHEDEPPAKHRHIVANPWGFADWFKENTPRSGVSSKRCCESPRNRCLTKSTYLKSRHRSLRYSYLSGGGTKTTTTGMGARRHPLY